MNRKEFLIVVFLVVFGLLYDFFEENRQNIKKNIANLIEEKVDFNYNQAEQVASDVQKISELKGIKKIFLTNPAGEVRVTKGESEQITLTTRLFISREWIGEKERIKKSFDFSVKPQGSELIVKNSSTEERIVRKARVVYELELPPQVALGIENHFGKVNIEKMEQEIDLYNRYGDIELKDIRAAVKVDLKYGDLWVIDLAGTINVAHRYGKGILQKTENLRLDSRYCHYTVKEIARSVVIDDAYSNYKLDGMQTLMFRGKYSQISAANINGTVKIFNSYKNIDLQDIRGDLLIDAKYCRIYAENVNAGDFEISNNYQQVKLKKIQMQTGKIDVRYCKVELSFLELEKQFSGAGKYCDWLICLPEHFAPRLEIRNRYGNFANFSHLSLISRQDGEETFLESRGDSPLISLENSYGSITLRKSSDEETL